MGVVVTCFESPENLAGCLETIAQQTTPPKVVLVAHERLRQGAEAAARASDVSVMYVAAESVRSGRELGLEALLRVEPTLQSVAHLDQEVRLESTFVTACERVFDSQPLTGLVAPWILRDGKYPDLDPGPCPMALATVSGDELPPYCAIRTEILETARHATWDTLATGGWTAITCPGPLVSLAPLQGHNRHRRPKRRYSGMALIQSQSLQLTLQWFRSAPLPDKARWLARTALQPKRVMSRLGSMIRSRLRKPPTDAPR